MVCCCESDISSFPYFIGSYFSIIHEDVSNSIHFREVSVYLLDFSNYKYYKNSIELSYITGTPYNQYNFYDKVNLDSDFPFFYETGYYGDMVVQYQKVYNLLSKFIEPSSIVLPEVYEAWMLTRPFHP